MRILFLTGSLSPTSGWGRIAYELNCRLPAYGFEPMFLTEDDSGHQPAKYILRNSCASLKSALLNSWKIRPFIQGCQLIHALDAYPYGIMGALGNIGINRPLVMTIISTYAVMPLENFKTRLLMKWAYRRADRILPITNYTKSEIEKRVSGLPPMERILLGVDSEKFKPIANDNTNHPPYFLSVGAFKVRKGYHFIIPALALLIKTHPTIKYIIVGDHSNNKYMSIFMSLVRKYGVESHVEIKSGISDDELRVLYQGCRGLVLTPENSPTNFANFHLVHLEANAMGKPIIGAKGYGTEEAVIDGYNGFLVNPENPIEIVVAMKSMLDDECLYKKMCSQSLNFARELSWDKMFAGYARHYRELLLEKR